MEQKKPVGCIFFIVLFIGVLAYVVYLWTLLAAANEREKLDEKRMNEIIQLEKSEVYAMNERFLEKFFTYRSTKERYEGIQELMTEEGYHSTFPSGDLLPESSQTVTSKMEGLLAYEYSISKTDVEFLNEFDVTTEYNGSKNKQTVIVRTKLKYLQPLGWQVKEVEFIGQLTGRISE